MDPAVDPFLQLIRLTERFKRDVNDLNPPASEEAIRGTERHLGHRLPFSLAGFLRRWNGASLFRGALVLRGAAELANPSDELPSLVVFADRADGRQWAYAPDGQGSWVFGEVSEGRLVPMHDRFDRWLNATLRVMDEGLRGDREHQCHLDADPDGAWLLLAAGERHLAAGDPEPAERAFSRATAADPSLVPAWQRLGEMHLAGNERGQARFALLKALRATRLPVAFPGAPLLEPGALVTLGRLFPGGDPAWERELRALLDERVQDVRSEAGARLFSAAVRALAAVRLAAGSRAEARAVLSAAVERARSFALVHELPDVVLELVAIETDLGEHDDAERHLRGLLRSAVPERRGRALLALGRIVIMRQEPWAEEILAEAAELLEGGADRARLALLVGERHLLHHNLAAATAAFQEADGLAVRCNDIALQGLVCIGLGDLARLGQGNVGAAEAYRAAEERAREAGDAELGLRVELRRGDLALDAGDAAGALAHYQNAARGYHGMDLPVREGWALLRVARLLGPTSPEAALVLRRARELFCRPGIQLAAGVGALDVLTGQPERSLSWHLACAAVHARHRQDARRARPPMTRADADRPERRLGAHRVAVGAAGTAVVAALEEELAKLARDLESSSGRPGDPKVAAYVAAADLLAAHRSFEAARVLLRHLLMLRLPAGPTRALKGAITRSANAALVDGLLAAVEKPGEPRATAAAAEVLGWRREQAAATALRALLGPEHSRAVRKAAVIALGRIGDVEAIDPLLDVLEESELAEDVAVSLLLLGDRRGVDFHGQALASGRELANPPGEIVGRYGGPSYLLLLLGAVDDEDTAKAVGALQGLGYLGDPRAVPRLLANLSHRDRKRVAVASAALELLTGHREDAAEPGVHARWERWWEQHGDSLREGVRHRDGRPLSPAVLVDKLGDDDALVRRGSYDELVITTGCTLPFDAEGPYRVQLAHQRAWRRWAQQHQGEYRPGAWWFHGRPIG